MNSLTFATFLLRPIQNLDWVIITLMGSLFLFVICKLLFSNNVLALNSLGKFIDVNDNQAIFGAFLQITFSVLVGSLFVKYMTNQFDYLLFTTVVKVLAFAVMIMLFFGLRNIFGLIGAYAFGIPFDNNYNLKISNFYLSYSVGVLWVAVLLFYFSTINNSYIITATITVLIMIRGFQYYNKFKNQGEKQTKFWYYNILYLCALEILPLLVIYKFLTKW